jgi:hypothetical protein
VVAPLICIGPPRAKTIHHAGGMLELRRLGGKVVIKENHRLMDTPIANFSDEAAPPENQVGEFHCILVRRSLMEKIGPLGERLITREQMDFALRCLSQQAVVRFEKKSIVTYSAKVKFSREDLANHLFRWADVLAVQSISAFEGSWGIELDQDRIRFNWIANHRMRAFNSCFPFRRRVLGRLFGRTLSHEEARVHEWVLAGMIDPRIPKPPTRTAADNLNAEL